MHETALTKPYLIAFENRSNYLCVRVGGKKQNYEILMQYFGEIVDECKKRNFKQVLVEDDISENPSQTDVFRIVSELPHMGFSRIRLAFVDRLANHKALDEFGILVATNRGIDMQNFDTVGEADKWLLGHTC